MRVTFITTSGYLDTAIPLINALMDKIDIHIIINARNRERGKILSGYLDLLKKDEKNLKVDIIFWNDYKTLSLKNWSKIFRIKNLIKGDVIHIQFLTAQYYFLLRFFSRAGQKLIFDIQDVETHTGEVRCFGSQFVTDGFVKRADEIIVHSSYSGRVLRCRYEISSRWNVVPFGTVYLIDNKIKLNTQEEPSTVLFFGRISPYKGIEYLIKAISIIKKEIASLKVILAGKGQYYFEIGRLPRDGSCQVINRHIPNMELAELIQRSAIVVCPYTDATQSGVIMTAYTFGKPVVATNVGGIPEVVEDGVTGLLVPPRDSQKLAEALILLLKDPLRREKMAENIEKKFREKEELSWDFIARKTIQVYEKAVCKGQILIK